MGETTSAARPRKGLRTLALVVVPAGLVLAFIGVVLATSAPLPASNAPYFAEEFSGSSLDVSKWQVETPWHTQYVTGELEWYQPANITFPGDGICRIVTTRETVDAAGTGSYEYASGILSTGSRADYGGRSRSAFTYGYFEMRAKLPKGKGIWPAFWLTDDRTSEIDVMEVIGQLPTRVHMSLHDLRNGADVELGEIYDGPDFSAGYHTFAVDWQPTYVRYYVDGVKRAEFTDHVPDQPLWIVANTAVGGRWPGVPDASTVFPQYFDIDYIRVWHSRAEAMRDVATP